MEWAKEWRNVVFSDEKKFNLDGQDGFHYWYDLREKQVKMSRNYGGSNVIVWIAFGYQ